MIELMTIMNAICMIPIVVWVIFSFKEIEELKKIAVWVIFSFKDLEDLKQKLKEAQEWVNIIMNKWRR